MIKNLFEKVTFLYHIDLEFVLKNKIFQMSIFIFSDRGYFKIFVFVGIYFFYFIGNKYLPFCFYQ